MFRKFNLYVIMVLWCKIGFTQISQFRMYGDARITIDRPEDLSRRKTLIILYALPAGNTTEQTMGKKIQPGDDWHFDIQHIRAQTEFIRNQLKNTNIIVAYLDNDYKAWSTWRNKHPYAEKEIQHIVDTIIRIIPSKNKVVYLSGHSNGGRFIFTYLDGLKRIPKIIKRISFLDSNYGYDSSYDNKLVQWLHDDPEASLNVFAYNDSVALLNGKRFVSDTGGTWYRSHMMIKDLSNYFQFDKIRDDSLIIYRSKEKNINFFLKTNPEKKIYHTVQVERNGFIHSVLLGTKKDSEDYTYFGERAYNNLIK